MGSLPIDKRGGGGVSMLGLHRPPRHRCIRNMGAQPTSTIVNQKPHEGSTVAGVKSMTCPLKAS